MKPESSVEERKEPQKHSKPAPDAQDRRIYRGEDGYDTQTPIYTDWASI